MDLLMFIIPIGSPIQRRTSDGAPLTDSEGQQERTDVDYELFPEAVMLTPEQNKGKWVFQIGSAMSWEVDPRYVVVGTQRSFYDARGVEGPGTGHIH